MPPYPPPLCVRLAESVALGVLPAIPRRSTGVAGEIVGLAHLGAALTGAGDVLAGGPGAGTRPAGQALAEAGLVPLRLGAKEGVALIEGVPMTTALAVLAAEDARQVLRHALTVLAAEFTITGAARDVLDARLARGDDALARVTERLRDLAGPCRVRTRCSRRSRSARRPRCSRTSVALSTPSTRRPSALSGE